MSTTDLNARRASFQKWYESNKDRYNRERRSRYHSDAEYRQEILSRQSQARLVRPRLARQKLVRTKFRLGEVAECAGVSMQTIRKWEGGGLIPLPTLTGGHRYYTGNQMQLIKEFAETALMVRYNKAARDLAVAKKSLETYAMWR